MEKLEEYQITKIEDLLLLFLPNFSLSTPFHFLLVHNNFKIIKKFVNSIEKLDFNVFLNNQSLIDKIIEMFEYILEEYNRYPKDCIKKSYCELPIDYDYYDYDEQENETEIEKMNRENSSKVKEYLTKITEKIVNNDSFNKLDFNT